MIAAVLFLMTHAAQAAQPSVRVGPWEVAQRESSCTLDTSLRSGTLLRIEYFPVQDDYFLLIANPAWPQIADGDRYRISIRGSYSRRVPLEARGVREEGALHAAMYIPVAPPRALQHRNLNVKSGFETILLLDQQMTITREGRPWLTLPLSDVAPALRSLGRCADRLAPQARSPLSMRLDARLPASVGRPISPKANWIS